MTFTKCVMCSVVVVVSSCSTKNEAPPDAALRTIAMKVGGQRFTSRGESVEANPGWSVASTYVRDSSGAFSSRMRVNAGGEVSMMPVGDGLVYLGVGGDADTFVVAPPDQVDSRHVLIGRQAMYAQASLTMGGTGLSPVQNGDRVFALAMNNDSVVADGGPLTLGATSFGPVVQGTSQPVLASQGDELWVVQQRRGSIDNELSYFEYVAALHRNDVETTVPAADTTGSFTLLPALQLDLDVRLSDFAALAETTPHELRANLSLVALPFGSPQTISHALFRGFVGPLVAGIVFMDLTSARSDPTIALPYGNPFPAAWGQYVRLLMDSFPNVYAPPGATEPFVFRGMQYVEFPLGEAGAGPVVPLVGPSRDLLVEGKPPGQAGPLTETPLLAWQAPVRGSVSGYVVALHVLTVDTTSGPKVQVREDVRAQFFTTETSLQVAPGILKPGTTYFYTVTALAGGVDVLSAPHVAHGKYGAAMVASDSFTL